MKVSIVTTCFNREATIGHAIRSVMSQTYPDIEHIVVDGASTDGTLEEIKKCNSPRIAVLISEKDHGCYEALNKGLRAATGDIVCWLHSDDFYFSDDVIAHVV
ncbi:MAG: glycosyltransferase, partial [Bacteroidales bacterium]|nr:glycosyltransferase [Bacteroidales bacterium]